ncbi:hypothetical protein Pse7429DRAFT_4524, partial [Pseudanabaena biceps PCC 7429]
MAASKKVEIRYLTSMQTNPKKIFESFALQSFQKSSWFG